MTTDYERGWREAIEAAAAACERKRVAIIGGGGGFIEWSRTLMSGVAHQLRNEITALTPPAAQPSPPPPAGGERFNGGQRCDTDEGPCACGAWHKPEIGKMEFRAVVQAYCAFGDYDEREGELCSRFAVSRATVQRWHSGENAPHLAMRDPVVRFVATALLSRVSPPPAPQGDDVARLLRDARKAFDEFENAIDSAQRQYHNYQEWTLEQWDPINDARTKFYNAMDAALRASSPSGGRRDR